MTRRPQLEQHLVDGVVALGVERQALLLRLRDLLVLDGIDGVLDVVTELRQPRQGVAGQGPRGGRGSDG